MIVLGFTLSLLLLSGLESLRELLLNVRGDEVVGSKLHGVVGTSLTHGAKGRNVLEHVSKGNLGGDSLDVSTLSEFSDDSTARVDVSKDISHVLLRAGDVDLHERLHEPGSGLPESLTGASPSSNLEGHDGGINVVVGSVHEGSLESEDGETSDDSLGEDRLNALLDSRNVLLGDGSSLDVSGELKLGVFLLLEVLGLELDFDTCVLSGSARLLLVGVVNLGGLGDGLPVGHLRGTNVGLDVELALHAVDNDLEVELAHTSNDGLSGLLVTGEAEGRILGGEADEGVGHLGLVSLSFWLNGNVDDGGGELHLLEDDRVRLVAEGLSGGGVLESDEGDNVTSAGLLDLGTVVGVHLEHAADALVLSLDGVVDGGPG